MPSYLFCNKNFGGQKNYFQKEFPPNKISCDGVPRINCPAILGKLTWILFDVTHLSLYPPFKIT